MLQHHKKDVVPAAILANFIHETWSACRAYSWSCEMYGQDKRPRANDRLGVDGSLSRDASDSAAVISANISQLTAPEC